MEKMRNKDGKVISYREKVYIDGKAISKTFRRKSDALTWKKNIQLEFQRRQALGIDHIESIDFESFAQQWLEIKKSERVARRTIDSYRASIKNYLLPCVGKKKLEKINFQNAYKVIQLGTKNNLGAVRINFNLAVFKQILNDAVKLNYLIRNPLKGFKKIKVNPKSLNYWLPRQIKKFLSLTQDDPNYPIYVLALNTGLRRGELMGLCWDKVDLLNRRIEISRIRDRYELKETTKTGIVRHIPLNDVTVKTLRKLEQNKNHKRFVFAYENGSLPDLTHMSRYTFRRAIERIGVPVIRFHDLRTTYASNFVMAGGDIFTLSKILGHTSVEMTAKRYAALHPQYMENVANTVQFDGSE